MARPSGRFAVGFSNFSFAAPGYVARPGSTIDPAKVWLPSDAVARFSRVLDLQNLLKHELSSLSIACHTRSRTASCRSILLSSEVRGQEG